MKCFGGDLASLLEHMDKVAGCRGLARLVRFEVSKDAVLALPLKGFLEEFHEGCQAVRIVRETELTATGPKV